jgi:hypothetical protein
MWARDPHQARRGGHGLAVVPVREFPEPLPTGSPFHVPEMIGQVGTQGPASTVLASRG